MNYVEIMQRDRRRTVFRRGLVLVAIIAAVTFAAFLMTGCTVTPKPVIASQASFGEDGKQTSGLLRFVAGGVEIDGSARARYNALIELYGKEWTPELRFDHGIKPLATAFFLSNDGYQKFFTMTAWKHSGRVPK